MKNNTGVSVHLPEIQPTDIEVEYVVSPDCPSHIRIRIGSSLTIFPRSLQDAELLFNQVALQGLVALAHAKLTEQQKVTVPA